MINSKLQDSILPGSELNPNSKKIVIMVDNQTIWPDVQIPTGPILQQQFDELEKDYSCSICEKLHAVSPPSYEASDRTNFGCVTCGKLFTNVVELYMHHSLDHSTEECHLPVSKKAFCDCKTELAKEQSKKKPPKKKKVKKVQFKVQCDYCEMEFRSKLNLERLLQNVQIWTMKVDFALLDKFQNCV